MNKDFNLISFNDLISEIINQKTIISSPLSTEKEKECALQKLKTLDVELDLLKNQVGYLTQEVFDIKNKVETLENKIVSLDLIQKEQKKEHKEIVNNVRNLNRFISTEIIDENERSHLELVSTFFKINKLLK